MSVFASVLKSNTSPQISLFFTIAYIHLFAIQLTIRVHGFILSVLLDIFIVPKYHIFYHWSLSYLDEISVLAHSNQ